MFDSTLGMTPADVAAVTRNNNSGFGFGGDGGWWVLIILLALFNGNGFGFGNGSGGPNAVRSEVSYGFDINGLENGIRAIQNGLCDGFYSINTNLLTGFDRVTNNTNQGFAGLNTALITAQNDIQQAIQADTIASMQNTNALSRQLADCCCENRAAIADVKYQMATDTCAIQNTIQNTTRDIVDNQNANTKSIIDFLVQDKLSTLQAENQNLKLQASQAAQNAYLVNELRPCPIPAYITCNPYAASYGVYGNGCCGCN